MTVRSTLSTTSKPLSRASFLNAVSKASLCATLILLSACASVQSGNSSLRGAIGVSTNTQSDGTGLDPIAGAAFWGTRYDRDPLDKDVAVAFSSALRKIGSRKEALKVIAKAAAQNPDDPHVVFEYGKVLIEDSRAFEAVRHLEFAQRNLPDSWQILSAYGVALDQIDEHEAAREKYNQALAIAPDAVSVMNNKGLSYALSGQLDLARNVLMQASGDYRASARVRQNLALVFALKGDVTSAERLARSDLPPQVAENNIAYYRALLSQPAYWQDFAANESDIPSFDDPVFESGPSLPQVTVEPQNLDDIPEPLPLAPLQPEEPEEELEEELEDLSAPLVLGPVTLPTNAGFAPDQEIDDEADSDTEGDAGDDG